MELSFSALVLGAFYFVSCFKKQAAISGNAELKKKKGGGGGEKIIRHFYSLVKMINLTQQD